MRRFGPTVLTADSAKKLEHLLGYFAGKKQLEEPLRERYWNFFGLKPREVVINDTRVHW